MHFSAPVSVGAGVVGHIRGFEAKLKMLGDGPGLSGFNGVIPAAVASYVFKRHSYEVCGYTIKAAVRAAIENAPVGVHRSQQDLIRYKSDHYLDECIHTAVAKFCLQSVKPLYPAPEMAVSDVRENFSENIYAFIDSEIERLAA